MADFRASEERGLIHLREYSSERVEHQQVVLNEIIKNLGIVRDAYRDRYLKPDPTGFLDLWDRYFEHCPVKAGGC